EGKNVVKLDLSQKATEKTIEQPTQIKEGVEELFDSDPKLTNQVYEVLGNLLPTPQQKQKALELYSEYLDSIFPESKVKEIVYHGTDKKELKKFYDNLKSGIHFGTIEQAKGRRKATDFEFKKDAKIIPTIINLKNALRTKDFDWEKAGDAFTFWQPGDDLSDLDFCEVETPYLIKSTPEGARDFVVPSRMNEGQFYALPQSPQTFKQLLMVGGMDKYFQIVKCFRDEDLRADRQPEFTQIDCEMAFVEQEDILNVFEGLTRHLLKEIKGVEVAKFPRITYDYAMKTYGNDKPDIRFGMEFGELNAVAQHKDFPVFNAAELVVGIAVPGAGNYTRKEIDALIDWVKRPQIGALGMVYVKCNDDGTYKSSVDKFYDQDDLAQWAKATQAQTGDMIFVLSGPANKTRGQLSALRMELATRLGLRKPDEFAPLWVVDFPLLELDEESGRYHAMHHPFTSPKPEDMDLLATDPGKVRANAYDMVLNGNEIGGGSIRIHDKATQELMFKYLGFTPEEAKAQFGFLMDAFQFGAPPHGGLAFGLDRLVAILGGQETIRDFIAFPKNNSGRDVMIDAPSTIDDAQLKELHIQLNIQA
ncbi:MAG: aspartyl-tRNA synthetase, partial [Bacteroidota bacterium]